MRYHPLFMCVLLAAVTFSSLAVAAPGTIPIRGQLLDADGFALTGGREYAVQFYDAETDGAPLGAEIGGATTLTPEGLFVLSVTPPSEILSASSVWYAIAVDCDAVPNGIDANDWFADRVQVESVPFALQAGEAMHVDAAAIADGSVSDTEFQALDGVSGALQTQLDAKLETADIDANTTAITANTTNVATNAAAISANDSDIATNAAASAANTTNIATNTAATSTNTAGVAANAGDIVIAAAAATANASAIATNASEIATNTANITANDTDIATNVTVIATKAGTADVLPRVGEAHVLVTVTSSATTNGANLLAAYTQAKALTPHGAALSATNRAVVIVPPGNYDLGTSQLTLDTEFVDLVGLTTARDTQYIVGTSDGPWTGVLGQTADDVRIENLLVECTLDSGGFYFGLSQEAAYYPDTNKPNTRVTNCEFKANGVDAVSMRIYVEYSGTFTNCTAGPYSFGFREVTSGTFTDCVAGDYSFGGQTTASGTFTRCTGGDFLFGTTEASGTFIDCVAGERSYAYQGDASGTFIDCVGEQRAFGGFYGTASGTFIRCRGGGSSFGEQGTASGTFIDCIGGVNSFGYRGIVSGTFTRCTAEASSFGAGTDGDATGGKFYFCDGGASSFTTTGSPTVVHCVKGGVAYP